MKSPWDRRIARAEELARVSEPAAELLTFYARLAGLQKAIFEDLSAHLQTDPASVAAYFPRLEALLARHAPRGAPRFAPVDLNRLLPEHWNHEPAGSESERFVARVLLQPFAEVLAGRGSVTPDASRGTCPFCGAQPLAAILRGEGDGGKRYLVCSLCAIEWEFRRILCPHCGEEDKDKLPVYTATEFDYIRVEACDTCQTYLKCIDGTKNGLAVVAPDELASVALNVWAEEHGYSKIEANLLGL